MSTTMQALTSKYVLKDGTPTSYEQIKAAFEQGRAVLVHGRAENHTQTGLMIGIEPHDTRGQCQSMWDESWTTAPDSLRNAIGYAVNR